MEWAFKLAWGKDFYWAYDSMKNKVPHAESSLLQEAAKQTSSFLETLDYINDMWKSPFVIYVKDFNNFKS